MSSDLEARFRRIENILSLHNKRLNNKTLAFEEMDALFRETGDTRLDVIEEKLAKLESSPSEIANVHIEHLAQKVAELEMRPVSSEFHTDFTPVLRQIEALKQEQMGLLRMAQTLAKEADDLKRENAKLWKSIDVLIENATYVGSAKGAA